MVIASSALFLGAASFACSDDGDDTQTPEATSTAPAAASESPTRAVPTPISLATIIIDEPPAVANGDVFALRVRITGATNLGAYQLTPQYDRDALVLLDVATAVFWARRDARRRAARTAPRPRPLLCSA